MDVLRAGIKHGCFRQETDRRMTECAGEGMFVTRVYGMNFVNTGRGVKGREVCILYLEAKQYEVASAHAAKNFGYRMESRYVSCNGSVEQTIYV